MNDTKRNRIGLIVLVGGSIALFLAFAFGLFGCTRTPRPAEREAEASYVDTSPKNEDTSTENVDSSNQNEDASGLRKELVKSDKSTAKLPLLQRVFGTGKTKYKHVTIQQVIGDGNKVASGDTKLKQSQQATDSGTLAGPNAQQTVVTGDGNTVKPTKQDTTKEAPGWAAALTGPTGYVLGAAVGVGLLYLFIAWRRKRAAQNLV